MQSKTVLIFAALLGFLSLGMSEKKDENKKKVEKSIAVKWEVLSKVKTETIAVEPYSLVTFSDEIKALDGKLVEVSGFMIPLSVSEKPKKFLLSQVPASQCFFCGGAGPTSLIEILLKKPLATTFEIISVKGKLNVLENDQYGLLYRITDATATSGM